MSAPRVSRRKAKRLTDVIEQFTSNYSLELTGKVHVKVTIRDGAHSKFIITSGSPSDRRSILNFRANVRRAVEELKAMRNAET